MDSIDSSEMRYINSNIVLKILWTKREISRSEIARITGMSRSTISAIINDIMEIGLLNELGSSGAKNGRRPVTLQFKDGAYSILGLDIGRDRIHLIVSDLRGNELSRQTCVCDIILEKEKASDWIFDSIQNEKQMADKQSRPLLGIGLAFPIPIALANSRRDLNLDLLPGWDTLAFREAIHRKFLLPVFIENDMKLGALAELRWGRGKSGSANIAVIKLSQPPEAGLIIDGKIHQGARGFAGQIANVILSPESLESAKAGAFTLRDWATHMNDPNALPASREEYCFLLASSLSNMLALLDLDEVVFIMNMGERDDWVLGQLRMYMSRLSVYQCEVNLSVSSLGETQMALGAATMVLESVLNDLSLFPRPAKTIPPKPVHLGGHFSASIPHAAKPTSVRPRSPGG